MNILQDKYKKIKGLISLKNDNNYQAISDTYSKEEYIQSSKDFIEYNKWFISFFEKLLEIKIIELQYVILKTWKLGLLIKKYDWILSQTELSEYLEKEDYEIVDNQLVLYLE